MIDASINEYLRSQRVGVLAVEMLDGSPHGATVHFAHSQEPFVFYFETNRSYRKAEPLLKNTKTRATFVIGVSETENKTFQVDGEIRLVEGDKNEMYENIYLGKFPVKKERMADPKSLRLIFTPTWWRFTDWSAPEKKIITSS